MLDRLCFQELKFSLMHDCSTSTQLVTLQQLLPSYAKAHAVVCYHHLAHPPAHCLPCQVHVAESHDGQKLAVKVQHAGLRESCSADTTTIDLLVQTVAWLFPDFNYQWLVDEIKSNLPKELDFKHEAQNAERCRQNLLSSKSKLGNR